MKLNFIKTVLLLFIYILATAGCGLSQDVLPSQTPAVATTIAPIRTATPTITLTSTLAPTNTPTVTVTATPTRTPTATSRPSSTPIPGSWGRYVPRTLGEIIELTRNEAESLADNSYFLNYGDNYPSLVEMTYTGQFRDVSDEKLVLITTWLRTYAPQLSETQRNELFTTEGLFIESEVEYWLPIQSQLIPYMKDELTVDNPVTLLVVWAGLTKFSGEIEWIFLVNNFPVTTP